MAEENQGQAALGKKRAVAFHRRCFPGRRSFLFHIRFLLRRMVVLDFHMPSLLGKNAIGDFHRSCVAETPERGHPCLTSMSARIRVRQ